MFRTLNQPSLIRQSFASACLILGIYACSNVPTPPGTDNGSGGAGGGGGGGGGVGGGTALADGTFLGHWSGVFKNKNGDGAALAQQAVMANFFGNDATTGTFRFDMLPNTTNSFASGTYTIFQTTSVLLNVQQTTMSMFPKGNKELYYNVNNQSLDLHDDVITMHMAKADANGNPIGSGSNGGNTNAGGGGGGGGGSGNSSGNGNSGGNSGDGTTRAAAGTDPTVGHWGCIDLAGNQWQVNIRPDNQFFAEISDAAREHGVVWLEGETTITRAAGRPDISLVVGKSDVAKYKGMLLDATLTSTNHLSLHKPSTKETMACDPI